MYAVLTYLIYMIYIFSLIFNIYIIIYIVYYNVHCATTNLINLELEVVAMTNERLFLIIPQLYNN